MSKAEESWLPVPISGFEQAYSVSNRGQVKRLTGGRNAKPGRVLKPWISGPGYPTVVLCPGGGKRRFFCVHRLVALAFLGTPVEGMEVNHIDGNQTNNNLENLEWVTKSENAKHAFRIGLHVAIPMRGNMNSCAKVNEAQVVSMRIRHAAGETTTKLSAEYGIQRQTVWKIVTRQLWAHIN